MSILREMLWDMVLSALALFLVAPLALVVWLTLFTVLQVSGMSQEDAGMILSFFLILVWPWGVVWHKLDAFTRSVRR